MEPAEGAAGLESPAAPRRAWLALPALIALGLIALDLTTDTDRLVTRLFYETRTGHFPLRHTFWLEVVMHQWTKYAVFTLGCLVIAGLLLSYVLPALREQRRLLFFLVLALSFAPLSVAAGKALSSKHCPWSVDEFGGVVPYTRLFESSAPSVSPGHCFPAGHASTGFALLAFYFAAYARRMRRACRAALALGLTAGAVLGCGRVLQGAHFVSHVLWSGLFCWLVMVLLYLLVLRNRRPAKAVGWIKVSPRETLSIGEDRRIAKNARSMPASSGRIGRIVTVVPSGARHSETRCEG